MDDSLCNVRTVRIRWNIEAQVIIFFVQGPNQHGDDSERGRDESCDGLNHEGQRHARVFKIVNLPKFFCVSLHISSTTKSKDMPELS